MQDWNNPNQRGHRMNWKDVPNLFINNSFKIRFDQDHAQHNLEGEIVDLTTEILFELERIGTDCTLIARKIEDMSDEELNRWILFRAKGRIPMIARLEKDARLGNLRSVDFLYLLSRGVYPFEWDETVIDTATL